MFDSFAPVDVTFCINAQGEAGCQYSYVLQPFLAPFSLT